MSVLKKSLIKIAALLLLILNSTPLFAGPPLDKTDWFACINKETCTTLSEKFRSRLKKSYSFEYVIAASLSALLAEYLRGDGEPIDLNVVESALAFVRGRSGLRAAISPHRGGSYPHGIRGSLHALINLAIGNHKKAREQIDALSIDEKNSISARLIIALSYDENSIEFIKHSKALLRESMIPPLAFRLARKLSANGQCRAAGNYLDDLMKSYSRNADVVANWARSKMDCNDYSRKIYKKLVRIYKDKPENYSVQAQLVRYFSHRSDFKKIRDMVSDVDINHLRGKSGAAFLTEWAKFELKNGDVARSQSLLSRAVILYPKDGAAHLLLGKAYLTGNKDISKAIASLKTYMHLVPNSPDAEKMKILVGDLERDVEMH